MRHSLKPTKIESRSETTILGIGAWMREGEGGVVRAGLPLEFKNSDVICRFLAKNRKFSHASGARIKCSYTEFITSKGIATIFIRICSAPTMGHF